MAQSASVEFELGVRFHGYHIERGGDAIRIRLYASAKRGIYRYVGYSLNLVDQVAGEIIASADKRADPFPGFWMLEPGASPVYRQWMELAVPADFASNHALWITLSLWREQDDGRAQLRILSSGQKQLSDHQVFLHELALPGPPRAMAASPLAEFANGFALDPVRLPKGAKPGETLSIDFAWRSDSNDHPDYVQFLNFVDQENGDQWGFDQQPLGTRLPTRLWYSGLADSETWKVPLPADMAPGIYEVFTGLQQLGEKARLPVSAVHGGAIVDSRVLLGVIKIARS